jgi:two-component system, cell cycle sensor histidine kinase PleC
MTQLTADIVERRKALEDRRRMERSGTRSAIQSAREQLTSVSGLDRTLEFETIQLYAQAKSGAAIMLCTATILVAAGMLFWVPASMALLWCGMANSAIAVVALMARRFPAQPSDDININSWRKHFVVAEFAQNFIWITVVLLALQMESATLNNYLMVALLIHASASSILASNIKLAIYSAIAPSIFGIGILASVQQDMGNAMLCALAITAVLFYLFLAKRNHDATLRTLGFRAEKDTLYVALEEANAKHNEARYRAEEANLAKSRFLATMSHELRTPLNAILGFSEVMKSELFGPHAVPQYKEYANDVHSSGQHLLNIINEILDLSRIEAGRYELNEEAVDFAGTVDDCRHMLDMRARAKQITVKAVLENDLPRVWADERALRQVVINLLGNAIKFTPQGGEIAIKVGWTQGGGQYVSIKDTGPGIPEDEIDTVQESFGRGTQAIKTAEQGTGLGLPIVKGLVDLHGGQFHLRSKIREGTEVIVVLPSERVMETFAAIEQQVA